MPVPLHRKKVYPLALIAVLATWASYMTVAGRWQLFAEFWPASVTMVFGSFIAGSTPAGGGAVAFPVFTKMLHVATDTARTHALMIQSVGMTMASIFILSRGIPIYRRVLKWACLGGALGMTAGTLFLRLPNPYPKVLFTSVVLAFGIKFAISHLFLRLDARPELPENWGSRNRVHFILAGLLGGVISSQTGSGIDLICFIVMTLGYGLAERRAIPTSVIIMASMSVLGFFLHGAVLHDNAEATKFWLVSVPIVAMGAPFGAFVAAHLPQRLLVWGILLLVALETTTTLLFVIIGSRPAVWLSGLATLLVTIAGLTLMLQRRRRGSIKGAAY
jgi:uncharacterized membrane protein YfcA